MSGPVERPRPTMRPAESNRRREELLQLGLELFGNESFESVSIDEIAQRAGVSRGLLYHYFGGKRDYYVATVRYAADLLLAAIEPDRDLPPVERLRSGLDSYVQFAERHADTYAALLHGGLGADDAVLQIVDATREFAARQILLGFGIREASAEWRMALRSWIGAVEAACLDWLDHRDLPRETLVELLLDSLRCHTRSARRLSPRPEVDGSLFGAALLDSE